MPCREMGSPSGPANPLLPLKDLALDFIERAIVLILFLYFANKMLPAPRGVNRH